MAVKYKTIKDSLPSTKKALELLDGKAIQVGVLYGEHAWLAGIHEHGCKIPVTPKMRAYLHSIGLHLKASTTEITIPPRPFIGAGYDENIDEVMKKVDLLVPDLVEGKMPVNRFCTMIGLLMSSKIKEYAVNLNSPPNSSFTVKRKGSSNPLVDTGDMINGIGFQVK